MEMMVVELGNQSTTTLTPAPPAVDLPKSLTPLSGIIVPILTPRCTMQVNHDLDPVIPGPVDHPIEVFSLSLDIWFSA